MRPRRDDAAEGLANFLGWFSIGLGVAEIAAPDRLSGLIGIRPTARNQAIMRAMGVREIAKGIGVLANDRPAGWLWGRVAGDVLDLALLGAGMREKGSKPARTTAAVVSVLGVAALDALGALELSRGTRLTRQRTEDGAHLRVRKTVTIGRTAEELYTFWRDFENLPRFMEHLESVRVVHERRSVWRAKAPAGTTVEWESEITEDRPNERIAWRSVEGSDIDNAGEVRFREAPGGRGTEVTVEMRYDPPGGELGARIAMLFQQAPWQKVRDELRAFKQVMEVGEPVVSDATVRSGPRPARPPRDGEA